MTVPTSVASSDGVALAVFDLGGSGSTLLVSHATGMHGRCYLPVATALGDQMHSVAFDYRGHGETPQPTGRPVEWERYGDDAEAMTEALGGPLVGFGHSMGGACLLMAAHRLPGVFTRLVLFEPIVFPPDVRAPDGPQSPMVQGALRRRSTFASYDAALANFASKPPLDAFTPEALEAYVRHGFAPGEDGQVHIRCRPEIEAATFAGGANHRTWELLADIEVPVLVLAGRIEEGRPAAVAEAVADALPNGDYRRLDALDHFGPMTHPEVIAAAIRGVEP